MPIDFIRASIQGQAPTGEVWSVNPIYAFGDFDQPTPPFEDMQDAAQVVADVTPSTDLRALMGPALSIQGARLEGRTLNGDLQVVGEATRTTPLAGSGTSSKPYQTAVVFSLRTPTPGARGRGRLYWPAIGASMTTTNFRWDAGQQALALTGMVTYLKAIGTAMGTALGFPAGALCVWSRAGLALHTVNTMAAGDVFDTQRRRRDRAVESYVSAAY